MEFLSAFATDVGIKKKVNQDALLIKTATTNKGEVTFACVCDGMGGLEQGEIASSHVICALSDWFERNLPPILNEDNIEVRVKEELNEVLHDCNRKLNAYGNRNGIQLGTTCTAALFIEDSYYVIHVGDTRLYEIMDTIQQITEDQTVLAREIALGRVSPQNAEHDTRGSILLQCIGASSVLQPEFFSRKTRKGVVYLLCTDGFRHKISEAELFNAFQPKYMTYEIIMEKQCQDLIELNKERMEKDNITVLLVKTI